MGLLENMDQRSKRFSVIDVTLAQCAAMFFALFIAKLIPHCVRRNHLVCFGLRNSIYSFGFSHVCCAMYNNPQLEKCVRHSG